MKTLSRRHFLQLSGMGAAGVALAACAVPVPETDGMAAMEPVHLQANIAFTQADYGLQYQTIEKWRDLFEDTHEGITVELAFVDWSEHHSKMLVLAAANELPDFIEVQASRSLLWIIEGVFLDIDGYAAADPGFDMDDFFEGVMGYYRWDGKTFALPYDHGPINLGFNKTLFEERGIATPTDDWTFDDLRAAAVTFAQEEDTWGFSGMPRSWLLEPSYLTPWGASLFNEDETECTIDSEEAIAALQWWVDLRFVDEAIPNSAQSEVLATAGGDFVSGKVAMTTVAPWTAPTWNALADFEWDVAAWPAGPVTRSTAGLGSGYGITKDTEHPEAAWEWLAWMTSAEGLAFVWAASGASTPPRKSVFDVYFSAPGIAPNSQAFLDAMDNYMQIGRPVSPYGAEFTAIRNREMDLINNGLKPVAEAVADMKKDGDPILAKNRELYGS